MIHKLIKKLGTRVGSRELGCSTTTSDYDYMILESDYNTLVKLLKDNKHINKVTDGQYETSIRKGVIPGYTSILLNIKNVKFKYKNKVINLLVYKNEDYEVIRFVKETYDNMEEKNPELYSLIKRNRDTRIIVFRQVVLHAKMFGGPMLQK